MLQFKANMTQWLNVWHTHVHFQSHISENLEEVKLVKQLFPKYASYTDVYLKNNLLTDKVSHTGCDAGAHPGVPRRLV